MELKINFSEEEMIDMLKLKGYTIEKVTVYTSRPAYHNDVETIDSEIYIAYRDEKPTFSTMSKHIVEELYGIEAIFSESLKSKIKFLFKYILA